MATTPGGNVDRRRAGSNYFQLDADRKRNASTNRSHLNHGEGRGTFGERLSMMDVVAPMTPGGHEVRGGGLHGLRIGIDRFGVSAPAGDAYDYFGLTPAKIAERVAAHMKQRNI